MGKIGTEAQLKAIIKKRKDEAAETGLRPPRVALPDRDVPGLVVRISPDNRADFSVKYTVAGKSYRVTLGRYPEVTLDDARAKALAARGSAHEARKGNGDHAAVTARKAKEAILAAAGSTVEVIGERFLVEYVEAKELRTAHDRDRMFRKYVFPRIGATPIRDVTRRDIIRMVAEIAKDHGPVMSRRVYSITRTMFKWAVQHDTIDVNPCSDIALPGKETKGSRTLNEDELRLLWTAAGRIQPVYGQYVRMLLATAQRRCEVGEMERPEINTAKRLWSIPAERMKGKLPHAVPLSPLALDVLATTPTKGKAVFAIRAGSPIKAYADVKRDMDRAIFELQREEADDPDDVVPLPRWTLHDLRRSARTYMGELGIESAIAERCLSHLPPGIEGTYNLYAYLEPKRTALEKWAARLAEIVGHKSAKAAA